MHNLSSAIEAATCHIFTITTPLAWKTLISELRYQPSFCTTAKGMQCGTFIIIASSCAGRQAVCLLTGFTRKTRCCCRSSAGTSGAPRGPWRGFPWRWHTRSWQATPPRSSGAFLDMQHPCSRPGCPHLCHAHDTECFDRRLPFSTPARKKGAAWLMQWPQVSLSGASRQ